MNDISKFVVDRYFGKNTGTVLVKHLLDSYNDFIQNKIEDVIDGFNNGPIEVQHHFLPDYGCNKYIIKCFVKNPIITRPTIIEKDGSSKLMTPADARNRGFTYAANLFVDLYIQALVFNEEDQTYSEESKKINNISLGKIPIMVKSKYCVLNDNSHMMDDECMYDYGGYFVVNGSEKIIVCQDRISENIICVFQNKNTSYSHVAEIRSVQENKFSVPKTSTLKLTSKPNQFGRAVRITIHHIKHDIPITVLFRALGVQTDKDIVEYILLHEKDNKMLQKELIGSFEEGNMVSCQRDAYEYLNKYMIINGYNKNLHSKKEKRMELITDIIKNEFLPHVGPCFKKKALFLGAMMNKLIKCYLGLIPMDDRDSYVNKKIDTPGVLMANLFRQYYGKVVKDMKTQITKDLNSPTWKHVSKLINIINNVNISRLIKSNIIEAGMRFSLATGNWGIKTSKSKQGVAQVLNRLTYSSQLSHSRRISTPVDKSSGKLIQPRKLHSTQYGVICPAETPEGISVGLVKNLSLITGVTVASNSLTIRDFLVKGSDDIDPVVVFDGTNIDIFKKDSVKVVVNGDIIGVHDDPHALFQKLKYLKCMGTFNATTSIAWNIFKMEIRICTEGGRCIRPMIIVKDNKSTVDAEFMKNNPGVGWNDLCTQGKIEYIDVEEANTSMIAMSVDILEKKPLPNQCEKRYTHIELHPSLMLGAVAATITFSNHNQAPRNCYQSSMGKQAIGVYASNYQKRYDTVGHVLNYPQKPIVQTDLAKYVNSDKLPCGVNAIIGIMTYTGYNQEDSVMINKAAINRGFFMSTQYKTYKDVNNKNHSTGEEEFYCKPDPVNTKSIKPFNYEKLEENGFVEENTYVESGDIIIGKCMPNKDANNISYKDSSVVIKNNEDGYIDSNFNKSTNVNGDGYTFSKVRIRNTRIPCIGDKFCLPDDAEVLVQAGDGIPQWAHISCVRKGDKIMQLNASTMMGEYAEVSETFAFYHEGNMVRAKADAVDILMTDEHKCVTVSDGGAVSLKPACELDGGESFLAGVHTAGTENIIYTDLAYMYGVFSYRGYCERLQSVPTGRVEIYTTPRLLDILDRFKLNYHIDGHFVVIVDEELAMAFEPLEIRSWILKNKTFSREFLEGYFQEDDLFAGEYNAMMIQLAGIVCGQNIIVDQDEVNDRKFYIKKHPDVITNLRITRENFKGWVYCVEVPSHMFYVRMNGKCVWTGNSSRHGQKGTVGMIYNQEDMPFTKEGIVPDIIINPHAIPSRMTIAQLMECIMCKAACVHGTQANGSPFQDLTVEDIAKALESGGYERHGNEIMYNPRTGEQMQTTIFIGPTFYQRLKHMVKDKIHSRSSCGPIVLMTRQPAEGRARDGGLRIGEMETICKIAHGLGSSLKERFMECSDNYRVFVCKKCKMPAIVNPEKNIYQCKACKNTTNFAEIRIPYAAKLLFQEVQTMSIGTKFITT